MRWDTYTYDYALGVCSVLVSALGVLAMHASPHGIAVATKPVLGGGKLVSTCLVLVGVVVGT